MCTVSWIHDKDGYQLLCNRDEKLTRKSAQKPRLAVRNGTRFLAPVDGDFGGTWIATNEFGVSVCLLNGANGQGGKATRSRGLLVLDLIPLPSIGDICDRVADTDCSVFAPFTMAALEPGGPAAILEWNGSKQMIHVEEGEQFMLTSSSFDAEGVRSKRQEAYRQLGPSPDFHGNHGAEPSAYSTCMHRADAKTVSFSRIQVSPTETDFFYTPGAPCEKLPGVRLKLARFPSSGSSQPHPTRAGQAQKAS